jgi:hypothetical protein
MAVPCQGEPEENRAGLCAPAGIFRNPVRWLPNLDGRWSAITMGIRRRGPS